MIIELIKDKIKFKKNKKNYEKNLQEYKLLMKDKIGFKINEVSVIDSDSIFVTIFTEKSTIMYVIESIYKYKVKMPNVKSYFSEINDYLSKKGELISSKEDYYYANNMWCILNDVKSNECKILNNKEETINALKETSLESVIRFFNVKDFEHFNEAINLIADDLKLNEYI